MSRLIRFSTAMQVFEAFSTLEDEVVSDPSEDDPITFTTNLLKGNTPEDAIVFCAYMLPRREAVWWGCKCVRAAHIGLTEADEVLLALAENWVVEPEEDHRSKALEAAMNAKNHTVCGWLALAAAWSGGSMNSEDLPLVPPPNYLTGQSVRVAVLSAMAKVDRGERQQYLTASVHAALKLIEDKKAGN